MSGGTPAPLVREISSSPQWSPSGDRIAFFYGDPDEFAASGAVIAANDAHLLWHAVLSGIHIGSTIRWLHDGSALLINSGPADQNNVWMYPFNGKSRRVTSFGEGHANFWDLSPDGTRLAISKATDSRDAVLITGFR
jgi:Tol biopolymer transport system component